MMRASTKYSACARINLAVPRQSFATFNTHSADLSICVTESIRSGAMLANYSRNIQGTSVRLQLTEVNPDKIKLDPTKQRLGFSMRQLEQAKRSDAACALLLTSQEETEALKRSIILSGGVQEPIYLRHNNSVAEGNRRVVAMRAAKEEHPKDPRFQ